MSADATREIGTIEALGYRFDPLTKNQLLDAIFAPRTSGEQMVVASANLHGLYMFERQPEYRQLHRRRGSIVIVDGMPIVWILKLLGHRVGRDHRTTWMDWFEDALDRAAREGRRVFVLGHTPVVLRSGLSRAAARWPGLSIAGRDGFFDLEDEGACLAVVEDINRHAPDIVFFGMGMPKQEIFAARYAPRIEAQTIGLGGAAFAYFAGDQVAPPRWVGRLGFEWAYRLACNPTRLARRYFLEPILLLYLASTRLAKSHAAVART